MLSQNVCYYKMPPKKYSKEDAEKARKELRKIVPEKKTVSKAEFEKARKALQPAKKTPAKKPTGRPKKPKESVMLTTVKRLKLYDDFEEFIELFISEYMDKKNFDYTDDKRDFAIKKILYELYRQEDSYKEFKDKYFKSKKVMIDWVEDLFEGDSQKNKNFLKRVFGR